MSSHCLKAISSWGEAQARIGLLDPIDPLDSLALAWAKAAIMCELGATARSVQGELARVMEPHAVGAGDVSRVDFEDADQVSLQAMASMLSGRQARQLAQDVGLAAMSVANGEVDGAWAMPAMEGNDEQRQAVLAGEAASATERARIIGSLRRGSWSDPLELPFSARSRSARAGAWPVSREDGGQAPAMEFSTSRTGEAGEARFACSRLRFRRRIA